MSGYRGIDITRIQLGFIPNEPIDCLVNWRAQDGETRYGLRGTQTMAVPPHLLPLLRQVSEELGHALAITLEERLQRIAESAQARQAAGSAQAAAAGTNGQAARLSAEPQAVCADLDARVRAAVAQAEQGPHRKDRPPDE